MMFDNELNQSGIQVKIVPGSREELLFTGKGLEGGFWVLGTP